MIIDDIDFAQCYLDHMQFAKRTEKPASSWDAKAEKMAQTCAKPTDPYLIRFLELMELSDADTLLDIGCGPGTICLAVADKLKQVYGLDYSTGMLAVAQRRIDEQKLTNATLIQKAWEDNWDDVPECDIVVASRSTLVTNMQDALTKLNAKAKKRVYTTHTVSPHFMDTEILRAIGRHDAGLPTYIYAVNILYQMGIHPKIEYIYSKNCQAQTETYELFEKSIDWSLNGLIDEEKQKLKHYYQDKINKGEPPISPVRGWAFVYWDKHPY